MKTKSIIVVGAGLVGSVMAIYLARLGHEVTVYERRPDFRNKSLDEAGRSINLALSHRGIRTLRELGLAEDVLAGAVPVYGRAVHSNDKIDYQAYSHHKHEFNYSISRQGLNHILLQKIEAIKNIQLKFNHSIEANNLPKADFILAADGASSHLRRQLQLAGKIKFSERYSEHSYKELTMLPEYGKLLEKNYLHIWPRHQFMFIALPNQDNSFTCTLFMPKTNFVELDTVEKIKCFFKEHFLEVIELIPDYYQQFTKNKTSRLKTVQGEPWWVENKILFIGDAAHAMLPYLGQGMNCGFEDCRLFNELLLEKQNLKLAAKHFSSIRKDDTDAITELSLRNYLEMCHKVVDADYLAAREKEAELAKKDPEGFRSIYELISYTSIPYHEILKKASCVH